MVNKISSARSVPALLLISVFAALFTFSLLFAHGDEEHEAEPATAVQAADPSAAETAGLDSVYQVIAAGFEDLERIFRKGCYDCHSDQTVYPWYYRLPPVKGLIDDDIQEAREHLDMSDGFPFDSHATPADDLAEIEEEIEEGSMPPGLYRLMHWSAKPLEAEQDSVFQWIDQSLKLLAAHGQRPRGGHEKTD